MKNLLWITSALMLFIFILSCSTESTPVYTLTTTTSPAEGGTITPEAGNFDEGEVVSLQANPPEGWVFSRWEQDLNTTANPMNITMDRDYNIVGVFEQRMHPLTITIEGEGSVRETIIQLKTTEYPEGTIIELNAEPASDWVFAGWEGDLSGTENPVEITVNEPTSVLAVFTTFPTVSTNSVESITENTAQSGGNVTDDGGAEITVRGVCWSTSQNPTTDDNCTEDGSGAGNFTSSLTNLNPDTRYYVRAYAINLVGTAYGNQREFRTESEPDDEDWPRDTKTEVVEVTSPTGRVWMDRNLGASRVAVSSTDEQAYGDLYQWGRAADGHQRRNSPTTSTHSSSDQPGHGSFILNNSGANRDWRSPRNDNLWQGVNGINNPCPVGYRLPTEAEWNAERQSWSSNNSAGAYNSPLRLSVAGYRFYSSGSLGNVGSVGRYWSGTVSGSNARTQRFFSSDAGMYIYYRASGFSVRCLKN